MAPTIPRIGLIIGSQRTPRAGPQIARFVQRTIKDTKPSVELSLIDLVDWNLPLFNEPGIPSRIFSAEEYRHPHTQRWSREIASYDGYVFVTPQYNWGYPASLKNALDYLFNEWKGKPAMIVSYGGHGGNKAAAQLKQVCQGMRMKVLEEPVCLVFPDKEFIAKASTGQDLGLDLDLDQVAALTTDGKAAVWEAEKEAIRRGFKELLASVAEAEK